MAFDFPATPTEGQVYAPAGGPVYVYQSPVWKALPPGSTATADRRNRIVNGAMQVSQQNGNSPGGNTWYAADQWLNSYSLTTGVMAAQRVQTVTPKGSLDRLQAKATTAGAAPSASQYALLLQPIEGQRIADLQWGTANAKKAVLRFGFKGPAGTYYGSLRSDISAPTHSYVFPIVIAAGQANIDTEQIVSIPGPTAGTFAKDTTCGLGLTFTFVSGTTFHAPAANVWSAGNFLAAAGISNGAGVLNNTFEIFDVGLYADPNGTGVPPVWETPDPAMELALCQRYYQEIYGIAWTNSCVLSQGMYCNTSFAVPPRPGAAVSGVNSINSSMAATVGALNIILNSLRELRSFTATANAGGFATTYTVNARM